MKTLVIFACFIAVSTAHPRPFDILQQDPIGDLQALLDNLFAQLKQYDPIHIDEKTIFDQFGMHFKVKNVDVQGFSNIKSDIKFNANWPGAELSIELVMPDFSESIESFDISTPLFSRQGSSSVSVKNSRIFINVSYNVFSGFSPSVVETSVESVNVAITGISNNPEVDQTISEKASNFLTNAFNNPEYGKRIAALIDRYLDIFGRKL